MKKPNNAEWTIFGDSNLDYFKIEGDGGGVDILRTFGTTEQELVDINHAAHCVNHHTPYGVCKLVQFLKRKVWR